MKFNELNNLHFVLVGAVATIIALFVYMWLDVRSLERSATSAVTSVPQTSTQENDTVVAVSDAVSKNSQAQRDARKHEELVKTSADFFRKEASTQIKATRNIRTEATTNARTEATRNTMRAGGSTDDWMFERGQDVTGAELTDSEAISTIE